MRGVVLLSGGMDSAALLAEYPGSLALAVDYGQPHRNAELGAALRIAKHFDVPLEFVNAPTLPMTGVEGAASVVPGRNLLLIALGVSHALRTGAEFVAIGANATDRATYPDCRVGFLVDAGAAAGAYQITLRHPFVHHEKADIVRNFRGFPWHLTYSCYRGRSEHCGDCGACKARQTAFLGAGLPDPTFYETTRSVLL